MNTKCVKRKCMVKGCKNIRSFALSRYREFGNSVIICADCLNAAREEIDKIITPTKEAKQKPSRKTKTEVTAK